MYLCLFVFSILHVDYVCIYVCISLYLYMYTLYMNNCIASFKDDSDDEKDEMITTTTTTTTTTPTCSTHSFV